MNILDYIFSKLPDNNSRHITPKDIRDSFAITDEKLEAILASAVSGWSIVSEEIEDGDRVVKKIASFTGGVPPLPQALTDLIGKYFAAGGGFTSDISLATNYKAAEGKSAYEVALANGFVGTEAEWVESLKQLHVGLTSLKYNYSKKVIDEHVTGYLYKDGTTDSDPGSKLYIFENTEGWETVYFDGYPSVTTNAGLNIYCSVLAELPGGIFTVLLESQLYTNPVKVSKLINLPAGTIRVYFAASAYTIYTEIPLNLTFFKNKINSPTGAIESIEEKILESKFRIKIPIGTKNVYVNASLSVVPYAKANLSTPILLRRGDAITVDILTEIGLGVFIIYNEQGQIIERVTDGLSGSGEGVRIRQTYTATREQEWVRIVYFKGNNDQTEEQYIVQSSSNIEKHQILQKNPNRNYRRSSQSNGGIISFIDDDGHKDVYQYLFPQFKQRGLNFGSAIVTGWVKSGERTTYDYGTTITLEELKEMANDVETFEMLNHTTFHTSFTVSLDECMDVLQKSNNWFMQNFGLIPRGFVYPGNMKNEFSFDTLPYYHEFAFGDMGPNTHTNQQNYITKRLNFGADGMKGGQIIEAIDHAIANNEWIVINTHVSGYNMYTEWHQDLEDILDYVVSSGIKCLKPSDAFDIFGNLMEADNGFKINAKGVITQGS